ncbi:MULTISPECIES: Asp-tRNA(Asn)/Glu-tRNA(Gln) amidotransferase subunit GatA [Spongiibacter]|uniref:Asp-tRNA(Asn)/Glu-tRNA(Gln) amidotransferase subunit GatA n=1 Tax=Spongiibacter TaxID=630749 RepID=UPI000C4D6C79|nr:MULTISPECIES: Asp-tRNA(Asn)/Glu-tRNA(Gln) amidotransferase subunit GatA [Spongiibacter]MAY38495.1 Asp-tRNA(Asn)/Glu-tRNA(Gln) amidotransferase GatCAB subunit A [Spongiibacter sp.]MBI59181.1 Asp-tRNA(Asn)/Glu-tRNA(Gln) amidotransferase GatCAB subunit A [Spongiibacter sp.]|tara:strand:+ start:41555 stop:43009 length:1455 start_codon:yes stop_codon:yes gene_type:complete
MPSHTVADLLRGLAAGDFSSEEITRQYLNDIEQRDGHYNSFISVTAEQALDQARAADAARANGEAGSLNGLPIAHKDIFCTEGVRTSCASKMLDNFIAPYSATVVEKMAAAGAVMLGKTNLDEFAMGSSNETSFYGAVRNPWNRDKVPGGSSGGSAAAVAAGLAPAATGTDTGGSIRQPAALCGLTGLKPTYGRVSRYGMIAFASSLDQAGPMARTAEDCALLLQSMAGFDAKDSTCMDVPVPDYHAALDQDLRGLKIGVPKEYFSAGLDSAIGDAVHAALDEYRKLGAEIVDITLPHTELAVPCYYVIAPAEASTNLSRFDGVRYGYRCENPQDLDDLYTRTRDEGFGEEVKRRILVGTYALSAGFYDAYYRKAQQIRRLIKNDFTEAFKQVDLIAGPTAPNPAFGLGEKVSDPVTMYLEDIYTIAVNLAGLPALSMPVGLTNGLPAGMQLIGRDFDEGRLLAAAHQYQQVSDWHLRRAPDCE